MWESFDMKKRGLGRVGRTACVLVEGLGIFHVALSEDVLGHRRQSTRSTLPQLGPLKTGVNRAGGVLGERHGTFCVDLSGVSGCRRSSLGLGVYSRAL